MHADHTTDTRCCNTCGETKPLTTDYFYCHKKSGLLKRCKICCQKASSGLIPKQFTHHKAPPDGFKMCNKCHLLKPATSEYFAKGSHNGWQYACKACNKAYSAEWYLKNKERANANDRKWTKDNPDKKKEIKMRRKARLKKTEGYAEPFPKQKAIREQGNACFYCRKSLGKKNNHVDHMTPITRGGTNHADNKCVCCHSCNARKHQMTADEFMAVLAMEINFAP